MFTPSSTIKLLQNIDITNDYINTFSWGNLAAQTNFFLTKVKTGCSFESNTYVRKERAVRVPVNVETLYNISYMMFQNTNFGTKWFYAFITDMRYINETTSEIDYEIDVLQTWYFEQEIKDCYVDREHVASDTIGAYRQDEGLATGNYVTVDKQSFVELKSLAYVIGTTVDENLDDVRGTIQTGVYSGLAFYAFSTAGEINTIIDILDAAGKTDAIKVIFTMPRDLISDIDPTTYKIDSPFSSWLFTDVSKNLSTLDGYTPKNNKLLCYPYNYLEVSNNQGQIMIYRYEDCPTNPINFGATCNIAPNPVVIMHPNQYNGEFPGDGDTITLSDFPLCSWSNDLYSNWLAQNQVSNIAGVASSALALGAGMITGNPIAIAGGVIGAAQSIGAFYEKSVLPNNLKGSTSGGANIADDTQTFTFRKKTIKAEQAKVIDDYFTRFGYKVNRLKTPNLQSRLNWNYIKMLEVNVSGNIPNAHLKKIHEIYKNGLTFWHNDNVGNYNRTNPAV
jgi:hypothetical protein